jgi:tetratricopeptide (TPR) repeat protein
MPLASCRSRGPTITALALGAYLLFTLTSTALAQPSDDERARGHFNAGASYFDQRRYDLAAREFEEAFRLSDRPALLLNLSTTYERLDQLDRAAEYLEQYLQREPTSPQRRTLEIRLEELRRHRPRPRPRRPRRRLRRADRAAS